jgi:hypothetical protein
MNLNCRPGDLAIIVNSVAGNEGKIVRCIRLDPEHILRHIDGNLYTTASWEVDEAVRGWAGDIHHFVPDSKLRPIRDPGDDAEDESKAYLPPVPTREVA